MRLIMTLLVRDEEDIIEQNLRHHLAAGVDHFIVMDNRSTDGTKGIVDEYVRNGVVDYIFEGADDYAQTVWVTKMARLAASKYGADWVINSDADEFWWPHRRAGLKSALARVPLGIEALQVRRHDFAPRPLEPGQQWLDEMVYRRTRSVNAVGQPLPPKVCHRAALDSSVSQGNHRVSRDGRELQAVETNAISILHFPVRTLAQLTRKIANGGAAYGRSKLPPGVGHAWRALYSMYQRDGLDAYFDELLVTDDDLPGALADGQLVVDGRLRDRLRAVTTTH